jgi:hypothetical protein
MLILNDAFAKTWHDFPVSESMKPASIEEEFWSCAIETIKASHPEFLFLAEAYWDLEPKLQSLGFDFTYDKPLYDRLRRAAAVPVRDHLRAGRDGRVDELLSKAQSANIFAGLPLVSHADEHVTMDFIDRILELASPDA